MLLFYSLYSIPYCAVTLILEQAWTRIYFRTFLITPILSCLSVGEGRFLYHRCFLSSQTFYIIGTFHQSYLQTIHGQTLVKHKVVSSVFRTLLKQAKVCAKTPNYKLCLLLPLCDPNLFVFCKTHCGCSVWFVDTITSRWASVLSDVSNLIIWSTIKASPFFLSLRCRVYYF